MKRNVLIVDDSMVVRRILTSVLEGDPRTAVAGAAANGRLALEFLERSSADAVILDVEMPEMGGLETLREIRRRWPRLPVVMFSTLTERGAQVTLEALSLGASDYVTKPQDVSDLRAALQRIHEQLLPRLIGLTTRSEPVECVAQTRRPRVSHATANVVVIGASTGGPGAVSQLMKGLPGDWKVPVFIVQHMPPLFTTMFAQRLSAEGNMPCTEASDGIEVVAGQSYLAPGDRHMTLERQGTRVLLRLSQGPPEHGCRPAVDVLFRSAAQVYGGRCLAVVLTGMGRDGQIGCERIRQAGGQVIVQDETTSVVWGMPGAVAEAGIADAILPLDRIAGEIVRRTGAARSAA